jgi:hypothetical protein
VFEKIATKNCIRDFIIQRKRFKAERANEVRLRPFRRDINSEVPIFSKTTTKIDIHWFAALANRLHEVASRRARFINRALVEAVHDKFCFQLN